MSTSNMKIRIKSFCPIISYQYNTEDKCCTLCKNNLMDFPATTFYKNNNCNNTKIAMGCCGHSFHIQCISKWLNTHNACPTCGVIWKYKTEDIDINNKLHEFLGNTKTL